ncbi:MAG: DUF3592 domain-containing protein [Oscillospiraceae bacterium]|nr:DUF3592 domain-containing protein [Oscillospiraceae bacterium]
MDLLSSSFIIVGLLFILAGGLTFVLQKNSEKACTEKTVGEVVGIKESRVKRQVAYSPIFSFNVNGAEVRAHLKVYRNPLNMKIGDRVPIYYDKSNPERVRLANDPSMKKVPAVSGVVGAVMLLIGLVFGALL